MSTIDLRDAFHTLQLAKTSQKYCGIILYYGSPTYHYLCMGMGMSVSLQIWQQFSIKYSKMILLKENKILMS